MLHHERHLVEARVAIADEEQTVGRIHLRTRALKRGQRGEQEEQREHGGSGRTHLNMVAECVRSHQQSRLRRRELADVRGSR